VPLVESMAEHRVYEPSVGAFLLAGALVIAARRPVPARLVAAATAVLALASVMRNRVWADPIALWQDAADKAPAVWAPHYALGDALRSAGDCRGAVPEYRRAIALLAAEPRAHTNLGICLAQLGLLDEARGALDDSLSLAPDDAAVHVDVAVLELGRARHDEARAHLEKAIDLAPDYVKPKIYLARLFARVYHDQPAARRLCSDARRIAAGAGDVAGCEEL